MAFFVKRNRSRFVRRFELWCSLIYVVPLIWALPDIHAWLAVAKPSGPIAARLLNADHTPDASDVTALLGDVIGTTSSPKKTPIRDLASLTPLLDEAGFTCRAKVSAQKHISCSNPGAGWTPSHCRREWSLVLHFEGPGRQGNITTYKAHVRSVCDTARSLAS